MKKMIILLLLIGCKANQIKLEPVNEPVDSPIMKPRARTTFEPATTLSGATYEEDIFDLGSREVAVANYVKGKGLSFINLHDDENTSVLAAVSVIDSLGGQLIQLKHSGERNVEFRLNGKNYEFDPNRMFTDAGAKASLEKFGRYSKDAHSKIRSFASFIVLNITSDIIFTLHNNTDNNYSAASYLDEYKNDAADVYLHPNKDPDDFYFVTERLFFDELKSRGYNVVLQNNRTMTDDGSLSVLAGRRDIPYINIETQHGHLAEQIDMLLTVYHLFN